MSTAEHIVETSLNLFYQNGFHASGVDLLSKEAGVTKKTLYRYFPSKDVLIDAALKLRHQKFISRLRDSVEAAKPALRPIAYIDFIATWVVDADFHGCAFINATAEYAAPDASPHQQATAHKNEIRAYLLRLCTEGGAQKPDSIATSLFLLGEGLIVGSQVQGPESVLIESAKTTARDLWHMARDRDA